MALLKQPLLEWVCNDHERILLEGEMCSCPNDPKNEGLFHDQQGKYFKLNAAGDKLVVA